MKTIYKYLAPGIECFIELPIGAKVLSFQFQRRQPYIWCLVDTDIKTEQRHFVLAGTGHDITAYNNLNFIGTSQDGDYVLHLFEIDGYIHPGNQKASESIDKLEQQAKMKVGG